MATEQSRIYNLALDEEERVELLQVLEQCHAVQRPADFAAPFSVSRRKGAGLPGARRTQRTRRSGCSMVHR